MDDDFDERGDEEEGVATNGRVQLPNTVSSGPRMAYTPSHCMGGMRYLPSYFFIG